jgi:hypothetical protein
MPKKIAEKERFENKLHIIKQRERAYACRAVLRFAFFAIGKPKNGLFCCRVRPGEEILCVAL